MATFATQWVATAPFLAEPYRGSDAYITHDGYMQAMVSTFDGGALEAEVETQPPSWPTPARRVRLRLGR